MSELHDRLKFAIGKTTYRKLGELTDTHPETVRRYMQGQSPSAPFLAQVCSSLGINGEWLLTGQGPMRAEEVRSHALEQANPTDLLGAFASTLQALGERISLLERQVQRLQIHLGAGAYTTELDEQKSAPKQLISTQATVDIEHRQTTQLEPDQAMGRIRQAVSKRASEQASSPTQSQRA